MIEAGMYRRLVLETLQNLFSGSAVILFFDDDGVLAPGGDRLRIELFDRRAVFCVGIDRFVDDAKAAVPDRLDDAVSGDEMAGGERFSMIVHNRGRTSCETEQSIPD